MGVMRRVWAPVATILVATVVAGCVPPSSPSPASPASVTATGGDTAALVEWSSVPHVDHYRIERAPSDSGPWAALAVVAGTAVRFLDEGVENGSAYWYRVSALAGQRSSAPSAVAVASPHAICGMLPFDTRWRPGTVHVGCAVVVPDGVTFTIAPGATGKFTTADGITVEGGGHLVIPPNTPSTMPATLTSQCDASVGGDTSAGNSDCLPGVTPRSWNLVVEPGGSVDMVGAEVRYAAVTSGCDVGCPGRENSTVVNVDRSHLLGVVWQAWPSALSFTGNDVDGSRVVVTGDDAPVMTGNRTHGLSNPVDVVFVTDLHGIHDNTADLSGTADERTWVFSDSFVQTTWTPDADASGIIKLLTEFHVRAGAVMTVGPDTSLKNAGLFLKVEDGGTLRTTGSPGHPATLTSQCDASVGGDTSAGNSDCVPGVTPRSWNLVVEPGGSVDMVGAEVRYAAVMSGCYVGCPGRANSTVVNVDRSHLLGVVWQAWPSALSFTGNDVDGSRVVVTGDDAPVMTGNRTHGLSNPVDVVFVADLHGIHDNTADLSGTADERTWSYRYSHVQTTWTPEPDASGIDHAFEAIDVDADATMTVASDTSLSSAFPPATWSLAVRGTLSASGSHFSGAGITVYPGATMSDSGSSFTGADVAVTAVPDYSCLTDWPSVTLSGSLFAGNGFDILNANKHYTPPLGRSCGKAVDAAGSSAASISFHLHLCQAFIGETPHPELDTAFTVWDVEGVGLNKDGSCPEPPPGSSVTWKDVTAAAGE